MKAISLPINVLVIIVLALIILIAILALFYGVWSPGVSGVSLEAAKNNACQMLISIRCGETETVSINNFDADQDGKIGTDETGVGWTWGTNCPTAEADGFGDNLASLCACYYFRTSEEECQELCGC